ncbi:MAG: integrase core domain-containing protein [Alphaproteobacteria bacterium]
MAELHETLRRSLAHARQTLADWKHDYNTLTPRSRFGNPPPAIYATPSALVIQREATFRSIGDFAPRPVAPTLETGKQELTQSADV